MKPIQLLMALVVINITLNAQNVGIGTTTPNASSMLDVSSTTKGLLMPRMSTAQRKVIASPATGLLVYDLDKNTVYMFDGIKWQPLLFSTSENNLPPATRTASDGAANDQLGVAVSISGNYAIAGASGKNSGQGSAYIFFRNGSTWMQQAKLLPADLSAEAGFGGSVSINGDYAIVGAAANTVGAKTGQGSSYLYYRTGTTWTLQAKLTASDGEALDNFGRSVSISGDYAIVGANFSTINGKIKQGSAYIFFKGAGWVTGQAFQSKLVASDGAANDIFGISVSLDGDYALVGSFNNSNRGAGYIYGRIGTSWLSIAKLTASDGAANDFFGYCVYLNGDYAIIGAHNATVETNASRGSAYIFFRESGWSTGQGYQAKLTAPDGQAADHFGVGVSLKSDFALAGAYLDDVNGNIDQGSGYLYKRSGTAWSLVRKIDDGSGKIGGFFGISLAIDGYNIILGAIGKNNSQGELSFLNIE